MVTRTFGELLDQNRLRWLRRIFLILSLTVFCLILLDQISMAWSRRFQGHGIQEADPSVLLSSEPEREPLGLYQEVILKRNLFDVATPSKDEPVGKVSVDELIKDLRLKGIVIITEPEAILEDARTQSTVFLREGSKLQEIILKEIKQESVILAYGDQEKELRIEGGL
jgi:type II secretory pathway component PulC